LRDYKTIELLHKCFPTTLRIFDLRKFNHNVDNDGRPVPILALPALERTIRVCLANAALVAAGNGQTLQARVEFVFEL
jgi:hypothetical protein